MAVGGGSKRCSHLRCLQRVLRAPRRHGKLTELVSGIGVIVDLIASPDLKYVYYTAGGKEPKAMRLRVADNKVEEITSLKGLRLPVSGGSQIGVAPDGSAVFSRDIGSQEIYALIVKWP